MISYHPEALEASPPDASFPDDPFTTLEYGIGIFSREPAGLRPATSTSVNFSPYYECDE